ncbi:MAG: hypothetical protein A2428_00590 [Bdellovibrionales bacterium RIFOXYC1_FULL_54_43]|nr:MAG: hypothetical protein A2428_00590 [Bdellovibrionales bacterium RIFOXYC1_FULL_54_43]OFZ82485.1 MAG: hypothetical protein A2603_15565 [Bdellovibrionales bacterium RIFOXYD1_FULL_55_31]
MPKIYECGLIVRGYELDSFGHVNHAVYFNYLEHARWSLLEQEGITLKQLNDWNRWPVIAGVEAFYLKPTFMGERLLVKTQVLGQGRSAFVFDQTIERDGTPIFRAKLRSVIVNGKGRPTEPPPEIRRLWTTTPEPETS